MANIKVSELPSASGLNDEDLLMVVQNNESKKISGEDLLNYKFSQYNVAMPNGSQNIYFRRYGHIVEVWYNGDISSFPIGQEVTLISNIPEEYRPDHGVNFSTENSVQAQVRLAISSSGVLSAYNYSTAIESQNNFQFHVTYLVD